MSERNSKDRRPPGPKPVVTKDVLLEAGLKAVHGARIAPQSLAAGLGIQMREVLAAAADIVRPALNTDRVSAPMLYKYWPSFDDYVRELVPHLFPNDGLDLSALIEGEDLEEAVRRFAAADRDQAETSDARIYFTLAGATQDSDVSDAMRGTYSRYESEILPALDALLEHSGRRSKRILGEDGLRAIATALTAQTEGLALRSMSDPDAVSESSLWSESAVALVLGLTEPVT